MNVTISPELENFVNQKLTNGRFRSPEDVVNESLRLLQKHEEKLEQLRNELLPAIEQSRRGESTPLDIDEIIAAGLKRLEDKQRKAA